MDAKKLSVAGFAAACAVVWSCGLLFCGMVNLVTHGYAYGLLIILEGVYPAYHAGEGLLSVVILFCCAFFDGLMFGALFAFVYNLAACRAVSFIKPSSR